MNSIESSSSSAGEDEEDGHSAPITESRVGDLFNLTLKFGLSKQSEIEIYTKYSVGRLSYFALALKQ